MVVDGCGWMGERKKMIVIIRIFVFNLLLFYFKGKMGNIKNSLIKEVI